MFWGDFPHYFRKHPYPLKMGPVLCSAHFTLHSQKKDLPAQNTLKRTNQKNVPRQRLGREVEFLKPWLGQLERIVVVGSVVSGNQKRGLQQRFEGEVDGREIKSLCQQNLREWHGKIWTQNMRKLQQTTHPFSESKRPKNTYSTLTLIILCICICLHDVKSMCIYIYVYKRSQIYLHLPKTAIEN